MTIERRKYLEKLIKTTNRTSVNDNADFTKKKRYLQL